MESIRFDALARVLAATGPRRALLAALAAIGLLDHDAAAGCKQVGGKCKKSKQCCAGARCRHGRCRCKKGWTDCGGLGLCRNLASDAANCGACGTTCASGCCAGGACRPPCGDDCCVDCFIVAEGMNTFPGTEFCCAASSICSSGTSNPADDRCCWPEEVCIDGNCCCDGCEGTAACGGTCCPAVSCCNGTCCGPDQVCARTRKNKPRKCVSADRGCTSNGDCYAGETCHGGKCCSGDRICTSVGPPFEPFCCPYGEYCDPFVNTCCPVGVFCQTVKKVRIRDK